jgi:hypothetical protein
MTFIDQFEQTLAQMLDSGSAGSAEIIRWASEKVLESYRNGITAGQKGATVKRQGESRRRNAWKPRDSEAHGILVRRGLAEKRRSESARPE